MLKNLVTWLICFGLSFAVASFGWAERGEAFMYIYLGAMLLLWLGRAIVYCLTSGKSWKFILVLVAMLILIFAAEVLLAMGGTWIVNKLFDVDFYVAYQIITFVMCFCNKPKSN